jgi:prepilin-type N-terminal cleavage/methylation domain-containing protein
MKRLAAIAQSTRERAHAHSRGFTLIELMVAMVVFLVVAGTAFSVFDQHMQMITHQENLSGVNLALRSASGQLQMDLQGAGQNLLGTVPPDGSYDFSTGVIIQNEVPPVQGGTAPACTPAASTWAYPVPSACFDSVTIFGSPSCTANVSTGKPPVLVLESGVIVSSATSLTASDPNLGVPATDATCFHAGDELLLIQEPTGGTAPTCINGQSSFCVGEVELSAAPTVSGSNLSFSFTSTGSNGAPTGCPGSSCTDPQQILYNPVTSGTNFVKSIQNTFTAGNTFLVDVGGSTSAITYSVVVNPSNAADTQLQRCASSGCAVLADEVIGFKVGATLWSNESASQPDIANYFFDPSTYCYDWTGTVNCNSLPVPTAGYDAYDYSLIRAVRISLIGRTVPSQDPTLVNFANGFDGGPYLIQQASTVVDLRNMSIGDYQN